MITHFLSWFPQFRALEAQLQESASARIIAEDGQRFWRAKCESAEEQRDKAEAENKYLMKAVADWQAIQAGHLPIFGVVPIPPPNEDAGALHGNPPRRLMREVQAERVAHSRRTASERIQAMGNASETQ